MGIQIRVCHKRVLAGRGDWKPSPRWWTVLVVRFAIVGWILPSLTIAAAWCSSSSSCAGTLGVVSLHRPSCVVVASQGISGARRQDQWVAPTRTRTTRTGNRKRVQWSLLSKKDDDEKLDDDDSSNSRNPPASPKATSLNDVNEGPSLNRRTFVSSTAATAAAALGLHPLEAHAGWIQQQQQRDKTASSSSSSPTDGSTAAHREQEEVPPFSSVRQYKTLVLSNGLPVILVRDQRALSMASAALTIGGAGQFSDPLDLPGLAHLMEHMILGAPLRHGTTTNNNNNRPPQELEDWLSDRDGWSNGYTAYDNVCFHVSVGQVYLQETLELLASLLVRNHVERGCFNAPVLRREVSRVDSELDVDQVTTQAYFLTKDFVNPEHPYARFGLGNRASLEQIPRAQGISVSERLLQFFDQWYQPSQATLVVVGTQSLQTLARWVSPFASTLSVSSPPPRGNAERFGSPPRSYPGRFLQGGHRLKQMVLARKQQEPPPPPSALNPNIPGLSSSTSSPPKRMAATSEMLTMEWITNFDYTSVTTTTTRTTGESMVTGTQMAFLLSQTLGRKGTGSLYLFLLRRGWIASGSVPRFTVPVDVSGFQLLKLELRLTLDGFLNRSAVVVAILDSLDALRVGTSFAVPRVVVTSWASVAKLFGYTLANRPPDVIELAQDAQLYGVPQVASIGTGNWYRFPSPEDRTAMRTLCQSLSQTLELMSNPDAAVVIVTAGPSTASHAKLPMAFSKKWLTEPTTGGRFLYEDMLGLASRIEELVLTRVVDREELLRPVLNTLIPLSIRPPRIPVAPSGDAASSSTFQELPSTTNDATGKLHTKNWFVGFPHNNKALFPTPRGPPEPTCRCIFVVELLSSRPARAGLRQAAQGELFKMSFESALTDLGELGAPAGLAHDISYNKYGMRIAVLGLSPNIGSYTRRLCRRLTEHASVLLRGPELFPRAITTAAMTDIKLARGMSPLRKRTLISSVRRSTAHEAAVEGQLFFQSVEGALCFAQGDLLPQEVSDLAQDVRDIFQKRGIGNKRRILVTSAFPDIEDLVYQPVWKPRFGSPCGIAGVPLISDACGRVPR